MDTVSFVNMLLDKLSDVSLFDLIRSASEATNLHMVLLDPGYRVVASWPQEMIGDPYWDAQQKYGFVPEENLQKIFDNKYPDATFQGTSYLAGADIVVPRSAGSIMHKGMLLGHLAVYHTDPSYTAEEIQEICSCLMRAVKVFFVTNNLVSTVSTTMMSAMVSRVFTGQHITAQFQSEWERISGSPLNGGFLIAAICQQDRHKSIMEMLGARLGNVHRRYAFAEIDNYGYVLFYNLPSRQYVSDMTERLNGNLAGYKVHCGVSELFYNIEDTQLYSYQSRKALNIGMIIEPEQLCHTFSALQPDIMLAYITENMDERNFTHPLFKALKCEDEENDTNYLETLFAYLECKQDSAAASRRLFIHRNTLLYRINHIEEVYGCSLQDVNFVRGLLLSYWTCEYHRRTQSL